MASRANTQAELDLVYVLSWALLLPQLWQKVEQGDEYLPFNPASPGYIPPASRIQRGVRGDVLLPPARAIGRVESVMAAAQQDAAFLGYTASAKGFRKGSKAFLKQYFRCISGLNASDNPVS